MWVKLDYVCTSLAVLVMTQLTQISVICRHKKIDNYFSILVVGAGSGLAGRDLEDQ